MILRRARDLIDGNSVVLAPTMTAKVSSTAPGEDGMVLVSFEDENGRRLGLFRFFPFDLVEISL